MRKRELIRKLKALQRRTVKTGWFPGRADIQQAAITEFERLCQIDSLVAQIIEKLESSSS